MRTRTRMIFRQDEFAHRVDFGKVGRELRWTGLLAALAVLLGLGAIGTGIALQNRRADAIEKQALALFQDAFPGRAVPPSLVGAMSAEVRAAQDRADTLGVYHGNLSALDVLTEISTHVAPDLEVSFDELTIDRQVVQIRGSSPSAADVERLGRELAAYPPFADLTLGEVQRVPRGGGFSFELRISLKAGDDE
jgi:hypothetical protein